jgi:hypothetical protein
MAKSRTTLLIVTTLTIVFACGRSSPKKNVMWANSNKTEIESLIVDTFSTFPTEIDGCSCYFSNDSVEFRKGTFIYVNDYGQTSFLKINGILIKFTQIDYKEIDKTHSIVKAKNEKYEMTIEIIDGIQNGDETWLKTGTVTLSARNGKTITKTFYGECGC